MRMMLLERSGWRAMGTYFFSGTEAGDDVPIDDEGLEFDSLEAACLEAERALRAIAADTALETKRLWMTVLDADRRVVHRSHLDVVSDQC